MLSALVYRQHAHAAKRSLASVSLRAGPRFLSSSAVARGDDHHDARPPIIQGPGAKPGTVPTDLEQATGIERFELLSRMEGIDPFDRKPMQVTHMGILSNPVKVPSFEHTRIIGCTGYPADSHDTLYMKISSSRPRRCPECGCAYIVDFQGDPDAPENKPAKLSVIHEYPGEKPRLKWGWADMTTHDGGNQR